MRTLYQFTIFISVGELNDLIAFTCFRLVVLLTEVKCAYTFGYTGSGDYR